MVQTLMATRTKGRNRKSSVSIFSSKVKCGDCGSWYGPKVWHSNDAYRKVIWQCNHKFNGQKCTTPTLTEDEIKELFLRSANQVIDQKEQFIAIYEQVLSMSLDITALESEISRAGSGDQHRCRAHRGMHQGERSCSPRSGRIPETVRRFGGPVR